jgi:hypothetical protein
MLLVVHSRQTHISGSDSTCFIRMNCLCINCNPAAWESPKAAASASSLTVHLLDDFLHVIDGAAWRASKPVVSGLHREHHSAASQQPIDSHLYSMHLDGII